MIASQLQLEDVPNCPVCGSDARTEMLDGLTDGLFGAPGEWTLKRCRSCSAAYLDPRLTESAIGQAYHRYYTHAAGAALSGSPVATPAGSSAKAKLRNGYLAWRYGYPTRPAWKLAAPLVPLLFPRHRVAFDTSVRHLRLPRVGARLLDVGCGAGEFLVTARALGWDAAGLEVDPVAAAKARERGFEVVGRPLAEARLPDSSYDAVTLNHVLEHLHDPAGGLAEVYRVLRPGGTIWIATPNLDSPLRRMLGKKWRGLEPPRHLVLFCSAPLRKLIANAGFEGLRWPAAYPLTRWIYEASQTDQAARDVRTAPPLQLKLLFLGSFISQRWSEQLVVTARKPQETRA